MNKGLLSFLIISIALFMSALYFSNFIQAPFISALNSVKITYNDSVEYIQLGIDKYFFQAKKIATLEASLQKYDKNYLIMHQLASEIKDLLAENNSTLKIDPKVDLVRAISYEKFGELNRIWIDMDEYNSSKIYGLIYKDLVAGIVVSKNKKPLALLNRDIKSSYAVYLGDIKAPGIAHGNNGENIVVKFIPTWFKISEGDEVVTSGLDNIFFKNLKVGKVLSVSSTEGYQNAIVDPYYRSTELNYFHLIRTTK